MPKEARKNSWYDLWYSTTGKHIEKAEDDARRGVYAPPGNPHARQAYDRAIDEQNKRT
jgi:hypothetical protein